MSSGAQLKFERWMQFVYVQFIKHVLRTVNYILLFCHLSSFSLNSVMHFLVYSRLLAA